MTFPIVVDEEGASSTAFGFKAVPNGVLIDSDGTIVWAKYGGFSVDNADDLDVVRRFFGGEDIAPFAQPKHPYHLSDEQSREIEHLVQQGHALADQGKTAEAVQRWRQALHMDPENLVIRKQIWAAEFPEKFNPVIDMDWQKEQLRQERSEEVAQGICGPDGCPLPRAT